MLKIILIFGLHEINSGHLGDHNALSKVLSSYNTMSGIPVPENPMVDMPGRKNYNVLLAIFRKWRPF